MYSSNIRRNNVFRGLLDSFGAKCRRLMCRIKTHYTDTICFRIMQKIHDENLTFNSVGQFAKFLQDMELDYRVD